MLFYVYIEYINFVSKPTSDFGFLKAGTGIAELIALEMSKKVND